MSFEDFLEAIVPEYDREKVYASDVKKLVSWFNTLTDKAPEVLVEEITTQEEAETKDKKSDTSKEESSKKNDEEAS